jgi:hypothetical protein
VLDIIGAIVGEIVMLNVKVGLKVSKLEGKIDFVGK